ncbi:MAG TPA: polyprenyl synthetase family protein [Caldithrix sp.]|nr:polyprenyl synthetase family protein [Caldithrix sp.]
MPKKISLRQIKKPFDAEIHEYERIFKASMTSNIKLIDTIVKYVVKHRGKGLRPLLVIMAAKLVGKPVKNTYIIASTIELLHTASLVHDDVVDNADIRRGFPSINAVWKNKISVLMGDYLLSNCLINATKTESIKTMQILADVSSRLSKGELLQIEKTKRMNMSEKDYFKIISNKTAALIGAAAQLGAMTSSDITEDHKRLKHYGENLGLAFQIQDDLLDYYGKQSIVGKPVGNDFKDKKITLPLIHAFQNAEEKKVKEIKKILKNGANTKSVEYIIQFVENYGGIAYTNQKQKEYAKKAIESLNTYEDSDVKEALINFVEFVISRTK